MPNSHVRTNTVHFIEGVDDTGLQTSGPGRIMEKGVFQDKVQQNRKKAGVGKHFQHPLSNELHGSE